MRCALSVDGWVVVYALVGMTKALPAAGSQTPAPPSTAVAAAPSELRAIRAQLLDRVRRGHVPSFAIGVVRGEKVVWQETLGWADREANTPATAETLYPVASISKSITATGILALVAQGKLQLHQSVEPILATARRPRASTDTVLVSHLLAHTSGVPHLWHYEYPDRPETVVRRAQLIRDNAFVAAPPGERFLYSNLGYGVLAQVIEKVGGAPFQRVMEQSLFAPLGMRHTTTDAWVGDKGTVRGYAGDGAAIPYRFRLAPDGGAGFFSTLHDLLRYALFHLGALEQTVPPRGAAITTALGTLPPEEHYFRGWGVVPLGGATVLISDGEMAGGTAALVLVPERQLAVVALCNATGCPAAETTVAILSALIPAFGAQFAAATARLEREFSAPGALPTGRFEGSLFERDEAVAISADFSDPVAPLLQLRTSAYRLQGMRWDRGTLEARAQDSPRTASGGGQRPRLVLMLWLRGNELRGVLQEEVRDDRPGFARLQGIVLKSVP